MGRTVPSFRIALESEVNSWKQYRGALNGRHKEVLEGLFSGARRNCSASSNAVRPSRFDAMFMAMLFENQKTIDELKSRVQALRLELDARD